MKCVCGYENRNGEFDDNWQEIKEPGEEFIGSGSNPLTVMLDR